MRYLLHGLTALAFALSPAACNSTSASPQESAQPDGKTLMSAGWSPVSANGQPAPLQNGWDLLEPLQVAIAEKAHGGENYTGREIQAAERQIKASPLKDAFGASLRAWTTQAAPNAVVYTTAGSDSATDVAAVLVKVQLADNIAAFAKPFGPVKQLPQLCERIRKNIPAERGRKFDLTQGKKGAEKVVSGGFVGYISLS